MKTNDPIKKLQRDMARLKTYAPTERATAERVVAQRLNPGDDVNALAELSVALMTLARIDSVDGALSVLDRAPEGWSRLAHGLVWKVLEMRVLKRMYDIDWRPVKQSRVEPPHLATTLLLTLVLRHSEGRWLGEEARKSFTGGIFDELRTYPLAVYALALAEAGGSAPTYSVADDSAYRQVIEAWNDEQRLPEAILAMCRYHMERTIDEDDSKGWLEFDVFPYPLFPVEYLALVEVRARQGLSTPKPEHSLLNTPLAELPPKELPSLAEPPLMTKLRQLFA